MMGRFVSQVNEYYLRFRYGFLQDGFSIISHLTVQERITLYRLALSSNVRVCLEIGSYLGASAYFISAALSNKNNGKLFCIDTWNNDAMSEGVKDTYGSFIWNISPFRSFIFAVRGFSVEVVEHVANETQELDLLFIDGDHSYKGVKADWEAYRRFLKPGSIVVFHDWGWAEGVKKVIREDVRQLVYEFGELPNMWWGRIR